MTEPEVPADSGPLFAGEVAPLLGGQRRPPLIAAARAATPVVSSVIAIALAIAVASFTLWACGFGSTGLVRALDNAFGASFPETLRWTTPLLLTGAATALAFRARVWNIGLDGQVYAGAIVADACAGWAARHASAPVAITIVLAVSFVGGAVFAAIPGLLRIVAGAPEIVTTVIFISIGTQLASYVVQGPLVSQDAALSSSLVTDPISTRLWLPLLSPGTQATIALYVALAGVGVVALYLWCTTWGYEHLVYGENATFSLYGVTNRAVFIRAMLISGGLGGLAGGLEVVGVVHALQANFNPGYGFSGIAVALAARNNPLAIVPVALFFGGLQTSGDYLQLNTNAPAQFVEIVTALVILLMTARAVERVGPVLLGRGRRPWRRRGRLSNRASSPGGGP